MQPKLFCITSVIHCNNDYMTTCKWMRSRIGTAAKFYDSKLSSPGTGVGTEFNNSSIMTLLLLL